MDDPTTTAPPVDANHKSVLTNNGKIELKDQRVLANVAEGAFVNHLFVRLVAKDRRFSNVDFRYSTFDTCYLRKCVFEDCDFTGCRFVGTNLSGSTFLGCKFDYVTFEKTDIDVHVLE